MLFHTPRFGLFFLCVLLASGLLARRRSARHAALLAASYLFYMAWNAGYVVLILFSTLLDYWVGAAIHSSASQRRKKALLTVSLVGNLGLLGVFKYYDFFVENIEVIFHGLGLQLAAPTLHVLLPVGISFYTFQSMSYTIDIYRGRLAPTRSLVEFALFVSFFPQLVAGPIVRAREFLPQLAKTPSVTEDAASSGLYLVLKGLIKKVVFADVIGQFLVDPVFADPTGHGCVWVLLAILGFKLQIYGDFSGYSDIAIGCGRMLGYDLPTNFRSPYKAHSIANYWQRWHLTLGSWFRDYVFFQLGGSRCSPARANLNIFLTFLLVGLWHGASWTFVLWGAYYGVLMCVERTFFGPLLQGGGRTAHLMRVMVTLLLTSVASTIFRTTDLDHLASVTAGLAAPTQWMAAIPALVLVSFLVAAVTHYLPEVWKEAAERRFVALPAPLQALALVGTLVLVRLASVNSAPFYYFQF